MLKLYTGFGSSPTGILVTNGTPTIFAYSFTMDCDSFYLFTSAEGFEDKYKWVQVTGRTQNEYQEIIRCSNGSFDIKGMLNYSLRLKVVEIGSGVSPVIINLAQQKMDIGENMPLVIDPLPYDTLCSLLSEMKGNFPNSRLKLGNHSESYQNVIALANSYQDPRLVNLINAKIEDCVLPANFLGQTNLLLDICATMYSKERDTCQIQISKLLAPDGNYIRA
jgi:hypothetical protein